jgi:predicted ABC-class ATPase
MKMDEWKSRNELMEKRRKAARDYETARRENDELGMRRNTKLIIELDEKLKYKL